MPQRKTWKREPARQQIKKVTKKTVPMPTKELKIIGKGLVVLGKWIAERHDQYKKLMKRIHKMIGVIALAENREEKRKTRSRRSCLDTIQKSGWRRESN